MRLRTLPRAARAPSAAKVRRTPAQPARAALVPDIVIPLIREHVCPALQTCAGLALGDERHQLEIAATFYDLAAAYSLDHGEAYVLRALLQGDWTAVRELCLGFDAYNAGLALVHAGLDRLEPLARAAGA